MNQGRTTEGCLPDMGYSGKGEPTTKGAGEILCETYVPHMGTNRISM